MSEIMLSFTDEAVKEYFDGGNNCAQTVSHFVLKQFNIHSPHIYRAALPFGAGISHTDSICGAVSGGLLAIGCILSPDEPNRQRREQVYQVGNQFMAKFTQCYSTASCTRLIGYDLSNPLALEKARAANIFHTRCNEIIWKSIQIACEIITSNLEASTGG